MREWLLIVAGVVLVACSGGGGDGGVLPADASGDISDLAPAADVEAPPVDALADGGGSPSDSASADVVRPSCEAPPGGFGCPCGSNGDCDSGYCVPWDEGFVCSQTCLTVCPDGWDCRGLPQLAPDIVFVCWPGGSRLCQPCAGDASCGDGVCAALGDGTRCVRPCGPQRLCPGGFGCEPVHCAFDPSGPERPQCVPLSGACDCGPWVEEAERTRPCRHDSADGTCWGAQTCDPTAGGWSDCSAARPAPEVCNDVDDDCDGLVDDVPLRGTACTNDGAAGACPGVLDCAGDGPELVCVGPQPRPERCNGVDDDCDGQTDEDFPGLLEVCRVGRGACERVGVVRCTAEGGDADCDVVPGASVAETCNGQDDDCDGQTDEDLAAPACALDEGVCAEATRVCGGVLGWLPCDGARYGVDYEPVETRCDGFDNDCDGATDEVDADGDGVRATACGGDDCDDSDPRAYPGAAEAYDLLDNDCDGEVDEGLVPAGTVIVSELLAAPAAVGAAEGEWLELYNAWHLPVNVAGWAVAIGDAAPQRIGTAGALVLPPQSAAVLCRVMDPAANGGVVCDGTFTGAPLGDVAGTVRLLHAGAPIDSVSWTGVAPFPRPVGRALVLDPNAFSAEANDRGGNWCAARDEDLLPGGDRGTPGEVNPPCSGAPRVDVVTPGDGMDVGGFPIVVGGAGFTGATDVRLGGSPCVEWEVRSDTEIHCTTAPHLAGDVDVTVRKGGAEGTLAGGYRYTGEYTPLITWASAGRRPDLPVHAALGAPSPELFGEVRWAGVTGDTGTHVGILGQVGWGPSGTHPRYDSRWVWVPATFLRPYFDNDEYAARVTIGAPGTYSYVFRFSEDGGVNWEYGDREPGTADGFGLTDMGVLVVP